MASTVQKIQDRLFGKSTAVQNDTNDNLQGQQPFPTGPMERIDLPTPLTIDIPKDSTSSSTAPQRKNTDNPDSGDENDGLNAATPPLQPYRERLAEKLGDKYKGAEKYRLEQDEARERHWKRWGPYLSDRQWVRCAFDFNKCRA